MILWLFEPTLRSDNSLFRLFSPHCKIFCSNAIALWGLSRFVFPFLNTPLLLAIALLVAVLFVILLVCNSLFFSEVVGHKNTIRIFADILIVSADILIVSASAIRIFLTTIIRLFCPYFLCSIICIFVNSLCKEKWQYFWMDEEDCNETEGHFWSFEVCFFFTPSTLFIKNM